MFSRYDYCIVVGFFPVLEFEMCILFFSNVCAFLHHLLLFIGILTVYVVT